MIKLTFNREDYSDVHVAADFHLNHIREFVWQARGFKSSDEHTNFIRSSLRSLDPNALLVFLGDYALNSSVEFVYKSLCEIPCKTVMVWGNHNSGIMQLYRAQVGDGREVYPTQIAPNVLMMGDTLMLSINRKMYFCSHMAPMVWDHMAKGTVALCGHSHGNLACATPSGNTSGKILDVGVDNALKHNRTPFFRLSEIDSILIKKNISLIDHHA